MPPRTRRLAQPAGNPLHPPGHDGRDLPSPAIGHNSQISDDALIAENFKLEEEIKAATAKLNEWAKPRSERIKEIEAEISRRLLERKADSTKTDSGTAYFSTIMNVKVEDRTKLFDFIADNWETYGDDMLQLGAAKGAISRYMEENDGTLPPGLSISHFQRLNIRRS